MNDYAQFLDRKTHTDAPDGIASPRLPDCLFPFQRDLVEWSLRRGRAAIFADCGMGKTLMQLVWAQNVVEHTGGRVLILTPLAVGAQTIAEAARFGIVAERSRDGSMAESIVVSNYEQLHRFDCRDFSGVVCDESSILKHSDGVIRAAVTRFMAKVPYRLLCTATAAPNDWIELGTSSEAIGELGNTDMLSRFFTQREVPHRMNQINNSRNHFGKLSFRVSQQMGLWRLKGHAEEPFWRWVASWARACRKPSDMGHDDGDFVLPPLTETTHVVQARTLKPGTLFAVPAVGFHEEREERRRTIVERCEYVARLVDHGRPALVFCQLNPEGDMLEKMIPGAVQVSGADSDEIKEERLMAFVRGESRVLVTKPKIAGFGMNFQHCAHIVMFVTHSYEQYYQSVRRCWRFGQKHPVSVDVVATEAEAHISKNLERKAQAAEQMFERLVRYMHEHQTVKTIRHETKVEVPQWLATSSQNSTPSITETASR